MNTIQQTLTHHAATIHPVVRYYDGNRLREECAFDLAEEASLFCGEAEWSSQSRIVALPGGDGRFDLECTFRLTRGTGVAVVGMSAWNCDGSLQNGGYLMSQIAKLLLS